MRIMNEIIGVTTKFLLILKTLLISRQQRLCAFSHRISTAISFFMAFKTRFFFLQEMPRCQCVLG